MYISMDKSSTKESLRMYRKALLAIAKRAFKLLGLEN